MTPLGDNERVFGWDIPRNDANRLQTIAQKILFWIRILLFRLECDILDGTLQLHQVDPGKIPLRTEP